jgi:hypothetical protein
MADVIELLRLIIWPITTLSIVLVLRVELQRFARNVADRIQSADTVTIGPKGLEFKGLIEVAPLPSDLQQRKVIVKPVWTRLQMHWASRRAPMSGLRKTR